MKVPDGNYIESSTASLSCEATGVPIPQISWYFNKTKLNNDEKYIISISIQRNRNITRNTLIILMLSSYDAGTYTCNATNTAGSVTSFGTVTVLGKQ